MSINLVGHSNNEDKYPRSDDLGCDASNSATTTHAVKEDGMWVDGDNVVDTEEDKQGVAGVSWVTLQVPDVNVRK